jgi:sulfate permease, SulP family
LSVCSVSAPLSAPSQKMADLVKPGYLFFRTFVEVEETIRGTIKGTAWHRNPVQFLVLDLTHVVGVDMSSAKAIVRVQKLLSAKCVVLVLCGSPDSVVAKALESVEVVGLEGVELFTVFNDAMECAFFV